MENWLQVLDRGGGRRRRLLFADYFFGSVNLADRRFLQRWDSRLTLRLDPGAIWLVKPEGEVFTQHIGKLPGVLVLLIIELRSILRPERFNFFPLLERLLSFLL